jgi:hypothetical protein
MKKIDFVGNWIAMLWHAMAMTNKGYARDTLKHTGRKVYDEGKWTGEYDCREDKKRRIPKAFRSYQRRYS